MFMSAHDQVFDVRLQLRNPAYFGAAHGGAPHGRIIVGAGKMVEAVCDVEDEFGIDAVVARAFLYCPFHIDDQIAGCAVFAGDRFAAKADDIGGPILAEKLAVVLRNAIIVRQQQGNFLPDGIRIGGLQRGGEPSGQPADCRQVDPAFLPVYQNGFHLSDRRCGHGACW